MRKTTGQQPLSVNYLFIAAVVVVGAITYALITQQTKYSKNFESNASRTHVATRGNCLADDCLAIQDLNYPAGELPDQVKMSLDEALSDEYKALTTYSLIINKFGTVRPFSMIKGAEEQHIASLKSLYDKYGIIYPENQWINKLPVPSTLQQACQTGVSAETANVALYRDTLLPAVTEYEDITLVFTNLMNASQQKHLPAFERCD